MVATENVKETPLCAHCHKDVGHAFR
jgi:hypothetical protein